MTNKQREEARAYYMREANRNIAGLAKLQPVSEVLRATIPIEWVVENHFIAMPSVYIIPYYHGEEIIIPKSDQLLAIVELAKDLLNANDLKYEVTAKVHQTNKEFQIVLMCWNDDYNFLITIGSKRFSDCEIMLSEGIWALNNTAREIFKEYLEVKRWV